jgi:hypothetical protein
VTATAPTISVGQPATINVNVNPTAADTNVIVDIEIYDQSGAKIFQKPFEGENISPSNPGHYSVSWTPSVAGSYTLKLGIFKSDWTLNYYWNDNVLTMNTNGTNTPPPSSNPPPNNPPPPPPPPPATPGPLDVWWPSNESSVSGVQPFKAMVENISASSYSISWQVDGGALNSMADNATDYPHKESLVNVNSWTWRGNGPYSINFVAKNSSGTIISQKSVSITVAH